MAATRAFREQSAGGLLDTYLSVGSSDAVDVASPQMKFIETLQKGRDFVWKRLNEIPHISCEKPQTALYAFPRLDLIGSVWKSDREFILDFLEAEGVLFAGGHLFGEKGMNYFRTVFTPSIEVLSDVFDRLDDFVRKRA